ncbi:30S ribosomal protein S2 [Candidatus Collierbacteria bacterium CG_4_10_14_0_8_um_filter_43_86]|uniref:Small ribosomal subunit protein uS2 n=2 Tax=Candidatus Collieribacteriota TaxID=1752725 RepID=A0A2H0DUN1_9BACT|nr:MAG: 30S ribosomal protein S2 [Candidatus Collierbacteria bacterium CG22_combo_CG10-13_8_21_14_all_43_12]PIZ24837.1 MAG: 30S ribosomal protein S2 [Candidatus Collierbacteria bacterium CG_4_10_14_0_8_um_filter_43_86]PJB48436.1 MAG: 30S ribosomal protein S2 [Candidatus Collierbacteria bacterium CG_4_9_14_3_um_filter_43_16]
MAKKAEQIAEVKTPKIKKSKTQNIELTAKETVKRVAPVKKTAAKKAPVVKAEKKVIEKKVPVKKMAKKAEKPETVVVDGVKIEAVENTIEVKAEKVKKEAPNAATTVEELFEAGAHFGHVVKKWNPKMKKYLWGEKNGIHIFDLEKTVAGTSEATKVLTDLAAAGKRIVLVGTKRQVKLMVEEEGKRLGIPYINQRWMGGLITNWKQLKQTLDRLNSLKQKREAGQLKKYTKKEQLLFDKEITKLERIVGGIATLKEAPEVVVVFDTHKEKLAVKEASNRGVTVVGLVDSNANPDPVDYLIPMNDDSAKALEIMVRVLGQAIENGMKAKKEEKK